MKKLLLALMTLLATSTIAMADQVELNYVGWDFDGASSWGSSYDSHTVVFDAATVVFDAANKQPSGNSIDDCPVTKGQPITVTLNDISNDITAITFNLKQWGSKKQTATLLYSTDGSYFSEVGVSSDNFTLTSDALPAGTKAVRVEFSSSSNQIGLASILLTTGGGSGEVVVSAPRFSLSSGTYYFAQTVEITATEGAAIYYTTDGTEPTESSTAYTAPIEITETTTLKAIAVLDGKSSSVTEATYTIETMPSVNSVAEFLALEVGEVAMMNNPVTLIYQSGSYNYTKDDTGIMLIYGNIPSYEQGDVIPGGFYGRKDNYRGTPQLNTQLADGSYSSDSFEESTENTGAIYPETASIADITAADVNRYVTFYSVEWSSEDKTISDGTNTLAIYYRFSEVEAPESGTYNVSGFVSVFNDALQLFPTEYAAPTNPDEIAAPTFSLAEGTYTAQATVELACATPEAQIYYTLDGSEPDATKTLYSEAIVITTTTTVKAIAIKDGESSKVSTVTYTIEAPEQVANIAEFLALEDDVIAQFTNPVTVVYQGGLYMYVEDATGIVLVYGRMNYTYNSGDVIPAGFYGRRDTFHEGAQLNTQLAEEVYSSDSFLAASGTADVTAPKEVRIGELSVDMVNQYVIIKDVTIDVDGGNYILNDGEDMLPLYFRFDAVQAGDIPTYDSYTVTGFVAYYNNLQLYPTEFTDGSGVTNAVNDGVAVIGGNGEIRVIGNTTDVEVYTVGGALVSKGENNVNCASGIYVVRVNGSNVYKVIVR